MDQDQTAPEATNQSQSFIQRHRYTSAVIVVLFLAALASVVYLFSVSKTTFVSYDTQTIQSDGVGDFKLIGIDINGKATEIIPDLFKASGHHLVKLSFPNNSSRLYFMSFELGSQSGPHKLFVYDVSTKKFSELAVSEKFENVGLVVNLSPEGKRIAVVDKANYKDIIILDLEKDKYQKVASIGSNETFSQSPEQVPGVASMTWVNAFTVEYSVYDQTKTTEVVTTPNNVKMTIHPLIEKRTVNNK